jgi:hypothetical protein
MTAGMNKTSSLKKAIVMNSSIPFEACRPEETYLPKEGSMP